MGVVSQGCRIAVEMWGHVWASLGRFDGPVGVGE